MVFLIKNKNKPESENKEFDVRMVSYYEGDVCDLVGLFILNCLK